MKMKLGTPAMKASFIDGIDFLTQCKHSLMRLINEALAGNGRHDVHDALTNY